VWHHNDALIWVSGHDMKTDKEKTPPNIHVLKCETCERMDVVWSWDSLEHMK